MPACQELPAKQIYELHKALLADCDPFSGMFPAEVSPKGHNTEVWGRRWVCMNCPWLTPPSLSFQVPSPSVPVHCLLLGHRATCLHLYNLQFHYMLNIASWKEFFHLLLLFRETSLKAVNRLISPFDMCASHGCCRLERHRQKVFLFSSWHRHRSLDFFDFVSSHFYT